MIWFATNTNLFSYVGGSVPQQAAALDIAYVSADEQGGVLDVQVDDRFAGMPVARTSQLNFFVWRTGLTAGPKQIVAGRMTLQFTGAGAAVSGQLTMVGGGYVEPGAYAVVARLTGRRR
ncbi:MAG TPA: hypothetical protein VF647_02640 [Longimicrobium sp.]